MVSWIPAYNTVANLLYQPQPVLEVVGKVGLVASCVLGALLYTQSATASEGFSDGFVAASAGCALSNVILSVSSALAGNGKRAAERLLNAGLLGVGSYLCKGVSEPLKKPELISNSDFDVEKFDKCEARSLGRLKKLESCRASLALAEEKDTALSPRTIAFGSTYVGGNPQRDELSQMVDKTHEEYAKRWNLQYRVVTESRLQKACDKSVTNSEKVDCAPYWNKIAVLREFLSEDTIPGQEQWYVLADDDMPVTNMGIDPFAAIDKLRRGIDSSIIVASDVMPWNKENPRTSVNTGLFFVRKDKAARDFIEAIWAKRNSYGKGTEICKTLGTCRNQDTLHEQQAMGMLLDETPSLLDRVVTVVSPRDSYGEAREEIAINTFKRNGCFLREQAGWGTGKIEYKGDSKYPEGAWRVGDWMGQTAGVPIWGWYCDDEAKGKPPGPIRKDKLKAMIAKTVR